jgi:hypothetical protein
LRKATNRFITSVRLYIRMELLGSNWIDFYEIWYFSIFRKPVEKIQVLLKPEKHNEYFTWRPMYITISILHEDLCTLRYLFYMKTYVHYDIYFTW